MRTRKIPPAFNEKSPVNFGPLTAWNYMLDSASLGAAEGGESTGEFICIAALVIVDSVVAVAVSPTSEPSCIS